MQKKEPGFAVWITGLPASGKSTLATALAEKLAAEGVPVQVLESDAMRLLLTPDLGYGRADREHFYHLLVVVGELLTSNGVNVIFDATAAQRRFREEARRRLPRFMEVYVHCPLEVCEHRDPKHIYEKAHQGLYTEVPGVQIAYEPPQNPEVTVDTVKRGIAEEVSAVLAELRRRGFIG